MAISLAFDPAGIGAGRTAVARTAVAATSRRVSPRPATLEHGEDVGLEALGQVLAEPRGFPARVEAGAVSDASTHAKAGDCRPAFRPGNARRFGGNRLQRTVLGGLDTAIVFILLVGSLAVTGHHIIGALEGLVGVHDAAVRATAASGTMMPHDAGRVTDQVTSSAPVPGQGS